MNRFTRYDVTPETIFNQRRKIIKAVGLGAAALGLPNIGLTAEKSDQRKALYAAAKILYGPVLLMDNGYSCQKLQANEKRPHIICLPLNSTPLPPAGTKPLPYT